MTQNPNQQPFDPRLSVDNCPYPGTTAPEGWRARLEGKGREAVPYSRGIQYTQYIYWLEGWNAADRAIAAAEREKDHQKLAIYLNGDLLDTAENIDTEDLASEVATARSVEEGAYVDDLVTHPDGSYSAYLVSNK